MALTVVDLLFDEAKTGKEILKNFKPVMTKEEYLAMLDWSVEQNSYPVAIKYRAVS